MHANFFAKNEVFLSNLKTKSGKKLLRLRLNKIISIILNFKEVAILSGVAFVSVNSQDILSSFD